MNFLQSLLLLYIYKKFISKDEKLKFLEFNVNFKNVYYPDFTMEKMRKPKYLHISDK